MGEGNDTEVMKMSFTKMTSIVCISLFVMFLGSWFLAHYCIPGTNRSTNNLRTEFLDDVSHSLKYSAKTVSAKVKSGVSHLSEIMVREYNKHIRSDRNSSPEPQNT